MSGLATTGNGQPFLHPRGDASKLAPIAKSLIDMKKELTIGTPAVPAREIKFVSKTTLLNRLNRLLPADCQVKTAQDAWYVSTLACASLTLIFPPALIALVYCFIKAKKGGKQ